MDRDFWFDKWCNKNIAFHEGVENPYLVKHFNYLNLDNNSSMFIPLCGKTRDLAWLIKSGQNVVGVELVESAIKELFEELEIEPTISEIDDFKLYSAKKIKIYVGDFFKLSSELLGPVDAIYDRAALIALPSDMRERYAEHLMKVTSRAPQLLITVSYNQDKMQGPPFSVDEELVNRYYSSNYLLDHVESEDIEGGLKGKYKANNEVWLLTNS